jgi:hypothetical protein
MRLSSQVFVNRVFENESIAGIIDELNWYIETQELPFRIAQVKKGKVEYLNLENERLDRVLYLLSMLIKNNNPKKGVN